MALFEIENLNYWYPESSEPALKNINLSVEEGELLLVVGASGSGKSSLARLLAGLIPEFYGGRICGRVTFRGEELFGLGGRTRRPPVGIVFQDPEKQLVMTTVEAEIAFGLENIGLSQKEMFRRVSEVMSFLGLSHLRREFTANLSGGQKQKVALAAVLAMQPEVLVLDEPTSQLDPVAAEDFFHLVEQLNKEWGYTIVLNEQRLERCFHLADRLLVMEGGRIVTCGPVREVTRWEAENSFVFIPPVAKFFAAAGVFPLPLTVKEGRTKLQELERLEAISLPCQQGDETRGFRLVSRKPGPESQSEWFIELKHVWFTYPNGKEALKEVSLRVGAGEFVVVIGENAAGKTTLIKQIAGLLKPGRGRAVVLGKDTRAVPLLKLARQIGYLPQNPDEFLFRDTVEEELLFTLRNLGLKENGAIDTILQKLGISRYRTVNPRDLSSGERQRVVLASLLVARPKILLLDEPTRGLDYQLKKEIGSFLKSLTKEGVAVVMVTHDVEFAAEYAERIVMMFDGRIVCDGPKHEVLGGSLFYSPQMTRLLRGFIDGVLTVGEGIEKILINGDIGQCDPTEASL